MTDILAQQRRELVEVERATYSADNFPGSAAWNENKAALAALRAFDACHPEIVAELRSAREAREREERAYWDSAAGREKMMSM